MSRVSLPARRATISMLVAHRAANGDSQRYEVSFGMHEGRVMECFANGNKAGSDMQAILTDACIAISVLLQRGAKASDLAGMFGENRAEGETNGPPASPLGAIARAAAEIDGGLNGKI